MSTGLVDQALGYVADHAWKQFGTPISIYSYNTAANAYTVPSDGIIRLYAKNNTGHDFVGVRVCNSDGSNEIGFVGHCASTSWTGIYAVPVFKGQKVYRYTSSQSDNDVQFIPYINFGGGGQLNFLAIPIKGVAA